ncbi:hypothetical protein JMG10_13315 [Nostoc ellipsosporum NOK]|nr:hypothetical protein [Nostoc ellipsosporum NOK]
MDVDWLKSKKRELGITDAHLAPVMGVERSVANKIANGKVVLNARRADAVAKLLKVSRDEVLFRFGISSEEPAPPVPTPARAGATQSDHQPTRSADAGDTVEIVQLDLTLAMGPGTFIEDFVESEMVAFDASSLRRITRTPSDRLRFVTGVGTSHEPKFQSSDQFLIDINERRLTKIDGYYWITYEGAHALKRLRPMSGGRIQIISENKDFDPIEAMAEEVRIEGRAIWFARGL